MLVSVIFFILGLLLLIKGGDWFVDSASAIARKFHLSELLIGATVVSIGTTLPEVMVSVTSALTGHSEIAYGNAIGSVICNTALIAALAIIVKPEKIDKTSMYIPLLFFFLSAIFYSLTAYLTGYFSRVCGFVLLALFAVYIWANVAHIKKNPRVVIDTEAFCDTAFVKIFLKLIVGAALIAIGADLLVDNGTLIARALNVPESVIALTFVALGTSLPELVTCVTSLVKGHCALSLGNIIGANVLNIVLVSGASAAIAPFFVPQSSVIFGFNASLIFEIPVMFAVMLILALPCVIKGRLTRQTGLSLLLIYILFCVAQFSM